MQKVEPIQTFEQIKLLADSRRMEILRLLMASPATLTQIAGKLRQSPARVRHHIKALESANLVKLAEVRTTGTVTEKFYCARAGAFLLQELVLPKSKKPVVIFSGSHDLALEAAASSLSKNFHARAAGSDHSVLQRAGGNPARAGPPRLAIPAQHLPF